MNFDSYVDGVVAAAAALVNVATPGARQGREYTPARPGVLAADITAALAEGSRVVRPVAANQVASHVEVALAARAVFAAVGAGDPDGAARATNEMLTRYRPTPLLERHDGEPWHLHFHGPHDADHSGWGGAVAIALATVLGSEYADRLGVCTAPTCDRVFVDVSRNGSRRFCSLACQNRVKAAEHRRRSIR